MSYVIEKKIIKSDLYQALVDLPLRNVCRSEPDRPINDNVFSLWGDNYTTHAFDTTTIAWEIFKPVNG